MAIIVGVGAPAVHGDTIMWYTPPSATVGSPAQAVSAQATFTTSANTLTITLQDTLANPKDVGQLLSGLSFTFGTGSSVTGSNLASSSGQEIKVNGDGTFSLGSTVAAGWVYSTLSANGGHLDVLSGSGHAGPAHTLIGAPGAGNNYSNANNSIAGNGPHNAFLNQSVTFTISGSSISANTMITSAQFFFGTTPGVSVMAIPEPSTALLSAGGTILLGMFAVYRSRRPRQRSDI
jgi:hypothetical protein